MRFNREQYIDMMTFGRVDRPWFSELFGPLIGLAQEWRAQGVSEEEIEMTAFDWDYVPVIACPGNTGPHRTFEPTVLEETAEYLIERDHLGRTTKLCKGVATLPLPLDFPVTDMDSWLKIKPMFVYHDDRIDWDAVEAAKRAQSRGAVVLAHLPGAFDIPRELMGEEVACLSYYDQPELMYDVINTLVHTSLKVLERISDHLTFDQLSVHEDLAGKSGPLVGPAQVHEFFKPLYRQIPLFAVSCDHCNRLRRAGRGLPSGVGSPR